MFDTVRDHLRASWSLTINHHPNRSIVVHTLRPYKSIVCSAKMVYCCESKRAAVLWSIMLAIVCLCLFVSFGAVDLSPQRLRQKQQFDDSSKELLLVHAVCCHFCFFLLSWVRVIGVHMTVRTTLNWSDRNWAMAEWLSFRIVFIRIAHLSCYLLSLILLEVISRTQTSFIYFNGHPKCTRFVQCKCIVGPLGPHQRNL